MGAPPEGEHDHSEQDDQLPALQSPTSMFKNTDFTIYSDEDTGHVFTPPPRLAARFHRPNLNRRRSSAKSSRRNSLASSQSHQSSTSYRTSYQSNHVAQYLRRASIIESRKARLAAREAHAEQVRLRAALAKATPRASNSEERAQAAQQARERYLAKVAAACAEEVARAKRVAEENRERRAAEELRSRLEIEEKHAEAERRLLEFKRSGRKFRSTSFASADAKKAVSDLRKEIDLATAAKRIQRAWRIAQRFKKIASFAALGLSIGRVREMSFEEATALLADEQIIYATGKALEVLGLEERIKDDSISLRTFLSAYMILGHPADIFNKNGQQEQDLIGKAKEVLVSFEALLPRFRYSPRWEPPRTDLQTLLQAYSTYLTAFSAWKSRDASVLIETMIDQFVALDDIWQSVKDDTRGEVANDYREGIRDNQVILLSKIKKLAGADRANTLIKRAIREGRRARARKRPPGDVRPRPLISQESSSASANPEDFSSATTIPQIIEATPSRPQDFELTELSRVFSVVPPNRILVHELTMDPSFKIEVEPQSDVRNALNREICESMRTGVEEGHGDVWTVAVADNIRKRLLMLLKPGNSMHKLLSEYLNSDHIRNQCRHGFFSYEKFFQFMADLLPRLCAPFRDAEVQALAETLKAPGEEIGSMIEKLFGLLHIIDLMSLDYTNYMLQQAAPTLISEASGYERRMFAQDLESGATSLQETRRWWRNACVNILTEASRNESSERPTFARIYTRGLVDLAVAIGPLPTNDFPATLQFDRRRVARMRSDVVRFVTIGATLLTAKNLLKRDVRSQWKPEAKRIYDALASSGYDNPDGTQASRILSILESAHPMPPASREQLSTLVARFLREAHAGQLTDPVLRLLLQRLRAHVFARLSASSSSERVRAASTASESLAAIGLSEFIGQIGAVVEELAKVARVDQAAHLSWYEQIARDVEEMGTVDAALAPT